jgi:hypothetical protein
MQNDYLNNKRKYNSNIQKEYILKNRINLNSTNTKKPSNVNINKLLNKVKVDKKNQKKEKLIFLALATLVISIGGIISII